MVALPQHTPKPITSTKTELKRNARPSSFLPEACSINPASMRINMWQKIIKAEVRRIPNDFSSLPTTKRIIRE